MDLLGTPKSSCDSDEAFNNEVKGGSRDNGVGGEIEWTVH